MPDPIRAARTTALVCSMLFMLTLGCAGESPTPSPSPEPSLPPALVAPLSGVPLQVLGPPWTAAGYDDTVLADRVNEVWTNDEIDALADLYRADVNLRTGWDPANIDLAGIRESILLTPNRYERIGPVSVTTTSVPGLPSLGPDERYLHSAVRIHYEEFDGILGVDADNKVFFMFADAWQPAELRVTDGFVTSTPTPPGS